MPPPNPDEPIDPGALLGGPAAPAAGWVQADCTLFAQAAPQPLYFPWAALHEALAQWRAEGRVTHFFFMRKPPGLRLRFWGPDADTRLRPALVEWLLRAEDRNDIRGFRFGCYEPEQFRFGGPAGMAAAHLHFAHDSYAALRYELAGPAVQGPLPRGLLSLISCHDLLRQCLGDGAEMWDVWKQLEAILQRFDSGPPAAAAYAVGAVAADDEFLAQHPPAVQQLVGVVRASNAEVAACLRAAQLGGSPLVGPRAWLVASVVFHWNRLGLTNAETIPMVATMLHHLQA